MPIKCLKNSTFIQSFTANKVIYIRFPETTVISVGFACLKTNAKNIEQCVGFPTQTSCVCVVSKEKLIINETREICVVGNFAIGFNLGFANLRIT